jgi:lipopolysaccharide/colanic/teichoic acid biosynthesis glycosyltransferase
MKANADTRVHENYLSELIKGDAPMTKLDDVDPRLIFGGKLLRATGLDELPQLINVMRGEMSLVGPRPCTIAELQKYQPSFRKRFYGLPGLTGSWQVNGKNKTTFRKMIALDIRYVQSASVWQDLIIMLRTFPTIGGQLLALVKKRRAAKAPTKPVSPPRMTTSKPFTGEKTSIMDAAARTLMANSQQPLIEAPSGDTQRIRLRPPGR